MKKDKYFLKYSIVRMIDLNIDIFISIQFNSL